MDYVNSEEKTRRLPLPSTQDLCYNPSLMAMYLDFNGTKIRVGDIIQVTYRISKEGDKLQTQMFEGILMDITNRGDSKSFTVRKIGAGGIGVERIFPVGSPFLTLIKLKKPGMTRRSNLTFLRGRSGKAATTLIEDRVRLEEQRKVEREEKLRRSTKDQSSEQPTESDVVVSPDTESPQDTATTHTK